MHCADRGHAPSFRDWWFRPVLATILRRHEIEIDTEHQRTKIAVDVHAIITQAQLFVQVARGCMAGSAGVDIDLEFLVGWKRTPKSVDRAICLLADPDIGPNEYKRQIRAYEQATSWRITAPPRWVNPMLIGGGRATNRAHNRSNGRTHPRKAAASWFRNAHDCDVPQHSRSSGQGIAQ
jgi:hypothetical protein